MGIDMDTNTINKKEKWFNQMDKAFGLLHIFTHPNLLPYIKYMRITNEFWTKMQ